MNFHEWRWQSLALMSPAPWQLVLAAWDYSRQIYSPGYQGQERRKGLVLDVWRGPGRWVHADYGAAYSGYYELPDIHNWECPVQKVDGHYYLVMFQPPRVPSPIPQTFFMMGSIFVAKAVLWPNGFDWLVVPNVGDRRFVHLPIQSPSKWHPLDIGDAP